MSQGSLEDTFGASSLVTQAQQVLVEAGRVLAESVDYPGTLNDVTELVVPALADWCLVDLVDGERLELVAARHRLSERTGLAAELRRRYPAYLGNGPGAPRVARTGTSELCAEIPHRVLEEVAENDEHLAVLKGLHLRSGLVVPLIARGRCLGAMTLISESKGHFSEPVLPLLEELGRQCGLAVDNARLFAEARESEARYRSLFESIDEGFCLGEPIPGPEGQVVDFRILEVNPAFYQQSELRSVVGRTLRQVRPELENGWFEVYDEVQRTGIPHRFVRKSEAQGRWFDTYVFPVGEARDQLAILFRDVTQEKRAERDRERLLREIGAERRQISHLFHHAPSAMCLLQGRAHVVQRANRRFLELIGHRDVAKRPLTEAVPELAGTEFVELLDRAFRTGEAISGTEVPVRLRQGPEGPEERWLDVVCQPHRDPGGSLEGVFVQAVDLTRRKLAERKLTELNEALERRVEERTAEAERRSEQLQALAAELSRAEERERRRLAEVLHDQLQQLLVGSKMQLDVVGNRLQDQELRERIRRVVGLLDESIETSRNLTVELSPPVLHQTGLVGVLRWLARWMRENHELPVEVDVDGDVGADDEDVRVLVYQAVRELLFNVAKHAGACGARVKARRLDGASLEVVVEDDGLGFDPAEVGAGSGGNGGFGLNRLTERIGFHGGDVDVWSRPGEGTAVTLRVPWRQRDAEGSREGRGTWSQGPG